MMATSDRRLIEDYLPVEWLSAEASGEPRTKGYISTLAPASTEERDEQDAFLKSLCRWGASRAVVEQARRRIGAGRTAAPRVLDCFAGGEAVMRP